MAKKDEVKEKVVTPAQGAEGTTENQEAKGTGSTETDVTTETIDIVEEVAPEWAVKLLESNQAVIDSNNVVVEAVSDFKENASNVVRDILETANSASKGEKIAAKVEQSKKPKVEVNKESKYVVREGKRFADKDDPSFIYEAGYNVSSLATERLQALLEQGIIEEA